jgi:hypothetical protein
MKAIISCAAVFLTLATVTTAEAKGCLKGAVVGGTAGHFAGHHGVIGAAAGCIIGRHEITLAEAGSACSGGAGVMTAPLQGLSRADQPLL